MILTIKCIAQIFHIEANSEFTAKYIHSPNGELEMQVEFWQVINFEEDHLKVHWGVWESKTKSDCDDTNWIELVLNLFFMFLMCELFGFCYQMLSQLIR